MSNSKRINIFLVCEECKDRNYSTSKSNVVKVSKTKKASEKISLKKFCKRCNSTILHTEMTKK